MIDYATFQRIQHLHRVEQLTVAQIAHAIALDARTVRRWLDKSRFRPRLPCARPSKLDPYKAYIRRLLEHHPHSAAQILRLSDENGAETDPLPWPRSRSEQQPGTKATTRCPTHWKLAQECSCGRLPNPARVRHPYSSRETMTMPTGTVKWFNTTKGFVRNAARTRRPVVGGGTIVGRLGPRR